ncbi:hypothetical protein ElyMa_002713400 [Elysia marginata]|uniref:Peptidase S1 domain-containing protein n=1 Tax=Elysia marginata TaxID=1093978 RepID=A0AAV4HFG4_9GAST|nr:hypothetical protein ElyMa_002713400 [Elysia marginata]
MPGRHECAIFTSREHEAAESCWGYKHCEKNPGHKNFISVQDFKDNYLPRLQSDYQREKVRSCIDRTVRLRVDCTSQARPDDDDMAEYRGTSKMRVGTGFVCHVDEPKYEEPCVCPKCGGNVARKQWSFLVRTAKHVVYNTEEAKKTKIDFFYDDDICKSDGRMKSVWGVKVTGSRLDRDWCWMDCVTCDEDLGERIEKFDCSFVLNDKLTYQDLSQLGLLPSGGEDCDLALIVSHPHGQPKKITVGEVTHQDIENRRIEYNTPTCPGSSGAPAFRSGIFLLWSVHGGSFDKTSTENNHKLNVFQRLSRKLRGHKTELEQINFGYEWLFLVLGEHSRSTNFTF